MEEIAFEAAAVFDDNGVARHLQKAGIDHLAPARSPDRIAQVAVIIDACVSFRVRRTVGVAVQAVLGVLGGGAAGADERAAQ